MAARTVTGRFFLDDDVLRQSGVTDLSRYRQPGVSETELQKIDDETKAKVDEATETARNAPPPPLEIASTDVWADGGAAWRV